MVGGPWVVGTLALSAEPADGGCSPYLFGTPAIGGVVMGSVALCGACSLVLGMACLATAAVRLQCAATQAGLGWLWHVCRPGAMGVPKRGTLL